MSEDVVIKISANAANAVRTVGDLLREMQNDFKKMGDAANQANESIEESFQTLGIKSTQAIKASSQAAINAYEKIRQSGTSTPQDIARAHSAMTEKVKANNSNISRSVETSTRSMQSSYDNFLSLGAKVLAFYYSLNRTIREFGEAIQRQERRQVFENLAVSASSNADEIIGSLKRVSKGIVTEQQAIAISSKALLLGLKPEEVVKSMEIASASMKGTGQTIEQAFNDIVTGIARQSQLILDNLGILVDYDAAQKDIAASLGKQVSALTDAERRQAFMNATFEAGDRIIRSVGMGHRTLNETLNAQNALVSENITNLKDVVFSGKAWLAVITSVNEALSFLNDETQENNKEISALAQTWGVLKTVLGSAVLVYENYIKVDEEVRYSLINTKSSVEGLNEELHFYVENINAVTKAIESQGKSVHMSQEKIIGLTEEVRKKMVELSRQVHFGLKTEEAANREIQDMISAHMKQEEALTRKKQREAKEREQIEKDLVKEQERLAQEQVRIEKEQTDKRKRLDKELLDARISSHNEALRSLRGTLSDGEKKYKEYHDAVISLEKEIKAEREISEKTVQEMKRRFLPESAKNIAILKDAEKNLSDARQAFARGDYEAAAGFFRKAQSDYQTLESAAKSRTQTFTGTTKKIFDTAIKGYEEASGGLTTALTEQQKAAITNATEQQKANTELTKQIDDISLKIETLTKEKKAIELEITVEGYDDAVTKKAELEKPTSSTHTIYVQTVQTQQGGGPVIPIRAQTGRYFPGYGGGDRIPILGEAGEYMNKKEAVNYWGVGLFDALNRIDVATVMASLGAGRFADGGPVRAPSGGGGDKISVDLLMGNKAFSMSTKKEVASNFLKEIKKTNILRGRYTTPY